MTRDDWKLVNCAACDVELLGDSMRRYADVSHLLDRPAFVAGRISDRPYCYACFKVRRIAAEPCSPVESGRGGE